ncbi:hypothetical protein [Synechococcus sp. A15-60]|uniref:hypothetical protein n=1 Tax=Synechococcus sp. A15-60 TaxID=1050655 RepID=UPI001647B572|nr:hypothetical protein [Synechococcus sp. A15-60]QNI47086.1 hypothetical protein SynA1560_00398 [Synechococcus sp. A15-60]
MSQLSIKLSDKADALIAQLQKEIFNRRRKKVTAAGVVESLVESGARSQSDKRFATSWVNLIKDIEKAAKLANAHGSKPSSLTDEEWVMVLSHRNRQAAAKPARQSAAKQRTAITKSAAKAAASRKTAAKTTAAKTTAAKTTAARATRKAAKTSTSKVAAAKSAPAKTTSAKTTASVASAGKSRPARRARKATKSASVGSAAGRMAKAAAQLASANGFSSPARS